MEIHAIFEAQAAKSYREIHQQKHESSATGVSKAICSGLAGWWKVPPGGGGRGGTLVKCDGGSAKKFFEFRNFTLTCRMRCFGEDFSWGYQLAQPRVFVSTW